MIRRPPRSTLFPTRRSSDLATAGRSVTRPGSPASRGPSCCATWRSEEHTSELQSRGHLVCRLLLEKKKKKKKSTRRYLTYNYNTYNKHSTTSHDHKNATSLA